MQLEQLMKDYRGGMSIFQIDYFVTSKGGPTPYAQYIQCLRELNSRVHGLQSTYFELRKLEIEIEESIEKSKFSLDDYKRRYAQIEVEQKKSRLISMKREIKNLKKELIRFYQQAVYLNGKLDDLTDDRKMQYEQELWELKTKEMFCKDILTIGVLSASTLELLISLPIESRSRLMAVMFNKDKDKKEEHQTIVNDLMKWYLTKKDYIIPDEFKKIEIPENIKQISDTNIETFAKITIPLVIEQNK